AEHTGFESWIQRDVAVKLFANAGLNFEQLRAAARRKDFQPVDLKATLDAKIDAKAETIVSKNVVALLPGSKHPEETVIATPHWAHRGIGQPDANGDRIYNGAVDNGTGLSQILEQARRLAARPPPPRAPGLHAAAGAGEGQL